MLGQEMKTGITLWADSYRLARSKELLIGYEGT